MELSQRLADFIPVVEPVLTGSVWETDFLPLLVLTRRGRSAGKNQHW